MANNTEIELDERMTEETKVFVTNYLKMVQKPALIVNLDVNLIRKQRDQACQALNDANTLEDITISEFFVKSANDDYEIAVTCYTPKAAVTDSPITVYFHGGGWTLCSRVTHHQTVALLTSQTKTVWLSVEYRLSPEFRYPVPLDDCKSVTEWVINNKAQFSSPNAKIGVSGDSAGATFAAVLAHELKDKLDFQILIYPCVHLASTCDSYKEFTKDCFILVPEVLHFFSRNYLGNYSEEVNLPRVSPIANADFNGLPKCVIIAAELDPLIGDCKAYNDILKETNNQSDLHIIKGAIHGFFNQPLYIPNAFNEAKMHIAKFLENV